MFVIPFIFTGAPLVASAVGLQADAQCIPVTPVCGCGQIMGSNGCQGGSNKFLCPCVDNTNGHATPGTCQADNKCHATGLDSGISQLSGILQQVLGKLLQGSPSGGAAPAPVPTTATGCTTSYFQTSDITQLSNPCAQYVAPPVTIPTSTSTIGCDILSQQLGLCNTAPTTDQTTNTNTNTNTNVNTAPSTSLTSLFSATNTINLSGLGVPSALTPGSSGNITFSLNGATIYGNSQDLTSNTGVAGFYGSDTFGGQPQGIAAQLCVSRPWATGFLSNILPVSFFDGLCSSNGYQVGAPPAPTAPVVQLQQSAPAPAPTTTVPVDLGITPAVRIWATPASVPLDTRTSIYWTSQGVVNCTETSPDGSFSQNSLSGGAATVPITGATTFTISCLDGNGNPVTGSTTVNLSI